LHKFVPTSLNDDPNLQDFFDFNKRLNKTSLLNFFHIKENPLEAGSYYGISATEFRTHSAGQIVKIKAPVGLSADRIPLNYVTHEDTALPASSPSANHSGLYRDPLPLSNGTLLAVHTSETNEDVNIGSRALPKSRYDFRIKQIVTNGNVFVAGTGLTQGIRKSVSFWDPDVKVSYDGLLWELQPVEVRARTRPAAGTTSLALPEQQAFAAEGVNVEDLINYLRNNNLALIVSRDVTSRSAEDDQQPYNLKVANGGKISQPNSGKIYTVKDMQILQGDQVRGYTKQFQQGRRVLAQPMTSGFVASNPGGVLGGAKIEADGSAAAFVPAGRALSWQLTDEQGQGVVRERYWVSFKAGEIRQCSSCHGLSSKDHFGNGEPQNVPLALRTLLKTWKTLPPSLINNPSNPNAPSSSVSSLNGTVSISVVSRNSKKKASNKLLPGNTGVIKITNANVLSNNNLKLTFLLKGSKCKKSFVNIPTMKSELTFKIPKNTKPIKVAFALMSDEKSIAKTSASVRSVGNRTLSNRQSSKTFCSALLKIK